MLQVEHLHYHILQDVNFVINDNECVGLMGPSGSGKTLLLRALADIDAASGSISLDGKFCADYCAPDWRRTVGLLPADPQWWYDTVEAHFTELNTEWLSLLGFAQDAGKWQITRLSNGEKQRLGLLRLLQNQPRVLLLDEPTASLDKTNIIRVEELLLNYLHTGKNSILWVSHDFDQVSRVAARIFEIKKNTLIQIK